MEEIKEIKLDKINSEIEKEKKRTDLILMISITVIIIILAFIISLKFFQKETPKTIDDLHSLNLKGKLKPEQGYIYNQYSFVFANGLWYTQVQNKAGTTLFDIPLHYGPRDLETIPIEGELNYSLFDSERGIYITFDPLGQNLNYVALAVGEFDQNIIKTFDKIPIASCDKNETKACFTRPIITCNNTNKPVLYLQQKTETKVVYENNCIIVQGIGPEIVRAVNRLLLKLYGIMP